MKIATFLLASLTLFAQSRPAAPKPAAAPGLDKVALEEYLRHLELWVPQVNVKIDDPKPYADLPGFSEVGVHLSFQQATKDEVYLVSQNGQKIIKGEVFDIKKDPFQHNLEMLKTDKDASFGPANAPVTIVEFGDFQCPVCKSEAEVFRKNLATAFSDKVKVYFKDYPLEGIHPWARMGSIAGQCVFRADQAAFWKYYDWVYENQSSINLDNFSARMQDFAKDSGVDGVQLGKCIDTKASEAEVNRNIAEGRALQVSATPTLFINGRKLDGALEWPQLEMLIRSEIDHTAKVAKTAEECCVVTIPSVVKK